MHLIEDKAKKAYIPVRFAASKLAEGDSLIKEALNLNEKESNILEQIIQQMEEDRMLDRAEAIADIREAEKSTRY